MEVIYRRECNYYKYCQEQKNVLVLLSDKRKRGVNGDVSSLISLSQNIVALGEAIAIYDKNDEEEEYNDLNDEICSSQSKLHLS